jgi:hypothetical protein
LFSVWFSSERINIFSILSSLLKLLKIN